MDDGGVAIPWAKRGPGVFPGPRECSVNRAAKVNEAKYSRCDTQNKEFNCSSLSFPARS